MSHRSLFPMSKMFSETMGFQPNASTQGSRFSLVRHLRSLYCWSSSSYLHCHFLRELPEAIRTFSLCKISVCPLGLSANSTTTTHGQSEVLLMPGNASLNRAEPHGFCSPAAFPCIVSLRTSLSGFKFLFGK